MSAMLEVVVHGTACFVEEVNIEKLLVLVSNVQRADLGPRMRMLTQEVRDITRPASR